MIVRFIHHSCFTVEFDDKVLIFDYFAGDRVNGFTFEGKLPEYPVDMPIYFFASHSHRDHFDMDILRFANRYEKVHFILSKDTKMSRNFLKKHGFDLDVVLPRITYVSPIEDYEIDDLKIHTLRSTDAGVAFVVSTNNKVIYHAGDLNWWKYDGVGELINGKAEREYKHQIRYLEEKIVNVAFVVLDPRLGKDAFLGLQYFMKNVISDHIFPMHMWQDYSFIETYRSMSDNKAFTDRIADIQHENQVFEI